MEKQMGRPKKDITRDKIVSVRMLVEDYQRIKTYADKTNRTVTEVMMEGADVLIKKGK